MKDLINKFSIIMWAKYFSLVIFQNYLVFMQAKKYIKYFNSTTQIDFLKSNGILGESNENVTKSDRDFAWTFVDYRLLPDMHFNRHCYKIIFLFLKR